MPISDPSTVTIAAAVGAGIGAISSGLFSLISGWISKGSEERRHMREIAVQAATEHWKFIYEKSPHNRPTIETLGMLAVNAMTMVSMVGQPFKTDQAMRRHLEEGLRKIDIAQDVFLKHKSAVKQPD